MEQLNELALQQQELGKQIKSVFTNSKKDPSARKTEEYVESRLQTVETNWKKIEENHKKMCEFNINHSYFETEFFGQLQTLYKETKEYLQSFKKNPQPSVKQIEEKSPQTMKINKQKFKIRQLINELDKTEEELQQNKTRATYERILSTIDKQWDAIFNMHEEIWVNEETFEDSYFTKNEFAKIKERYEMYHDQLQEKITNLNEAPSSKIHIPLPQIKIPYFNGNYENWSEFHDLFQKIVHNNPSLSQVEKMQYLKTYVKNEPSRIIQHLQVSANNYETAWNLLKKRYHNSRLVLFKLIDKILDLPTVPYPCAEKLKQLHDTTTECLEGIKNLEVNCSTWGPLISRIISRKWDQETNKIYEQSLSNPHEIQEYETFMEFLEKRFQSLEVTSRAKKVYKYQAPTVKEQGNCKYCNDSHNIYVCPKFKELSPDKRIEAVKEKKLCYNCLGSHLKEKCQTKFRCRNCQKPHHTLLHKEIEDKPQSARSANISSKQTSSPRQVTSNVGRQDQTVLLATAIVKARCSNGSYEYLRALIDPGSQASFITDQAAQILSLPKQKIQAEISGLGDVAPKISKWKIETNILPRFPSNFDVNVELLVLPKLTQKMPQTPLDVNNVEWKNCFLADPTFNKPGPIDIILGTKEYGKILLEGLQKLENGMLGQNTEFGWILSGDINNSVKKNIQVLSMMTRIEEDEQLTKFWETEEVTATKIITKDDEKCEKIYQETTQRNSDGTYTVRIPFKEEVQDLGNSRSRAVSRLLQVEKRLSKNEELKQDYHAFMEEYLRMGHMKKITNEEKRKGIYYIPHQAVIRETSTTTKLRVVFDASCKTSIGRSLNEIMHTGPKLQQELSDILLRWRTHKVVFTADIEKMYRQIKLHEDDQRYHRILWRWDENKPIDEYSLTTVTYGTTSAPYLAIRTLQQLAHDKKEEFPEAASVVMKDFYVDDLMSGASTVEEARSRQQDLIQLLQSGGFNLRKWSSNSIQLIQHLPEELRDQETLEITEDKLKKSLGVYWAPVNDVFTYKVDVSHCNQVTKRHIISEIAKIFDPLGWLAPVIIKAKLLIQELWLTNLQWDERVPEETLNKWQLFQKQLKSIEKISVPRWIKYDPHEHQIELHGFCDASEKAYGALVYSKTISKITGTTNVTLLAAKSKVAPAKTKTTLPRLELCAAVLLAKLIKKIAAAIDFNDVSVSAWTDSMIVISWINGDVSKWKTFVANRVSTIIRIIPPSSWHHVKTEDNPADIVSRGTEPSKLKELKIWWQGPSWLSDKEIKHCSRNEISPTTQERKICIQATVQHTDNPLCTRFSSLTRMVRVVAYCRRFIERCKKNSQETGPLKVSEMDAALKNVIRQIQQAEFTQEIKTLKEKKENEKISKISNLSPFLDNEEILRVGGRLQHSLLSYNEKHPIILPYRNHLTNLIVKDAHQVTLHGGNQVTLAYIRRKFWIINGKKAVKFFIRNCTRCLRFRAQTADQLMGELPAPRVTPSSPFVHSGIDYAGPIQIRTTRGRGHKSYKGYIVIFVCMATKAIHLEVVSDMSSEAFLAAYRRFIARRGSCAHLYSDNGTTFVGAHHMFEEEVRKILEKSKSWMK